jgi:hypothetical protein
MTESFPDVLRSDAATTVVDTRPTNAAADASLARQVRREPPAGLRALTLFASLDGRTTLVYAQWGSEADHLSWWTTNRSGEPDPGRHFTVYRSYRPEPAGRASMLATPLFATDGHDTQRALADAVVTVLTDLRPEGLLGAHLHLSADGRRVINYAEWADAGAWHTFVDGPAATTMRAAFAAAPGAVPLNSPLGVARFGVRAAFNSTAASPGSEGHVGAEQ